MFITAPAIGIVLGALVYGFAKGKVEELGRILFAASTLALMLSLTGKHF